jgi:GNAT superfamily N-acetyltransferase
VVEVVLIDPGDAKAFDAWFDVLHITDLERWPDQPGWQRAERLAWATDTEGPEQHDCLSAIAVDGTVVGIADVETFRRENTKVARADIRVLPQFRRRGVGSAILEEATRLARTMGRTELGGMDEKPVRAGYAHAATGFATRHGFAAAQPMVRRALQLPLEPSRRSALFDSPAASPTGYTMLTFVDRWPDEYMADRCLLGKRMSTDVPMGDQELDEEEWDEQRVRQVEATLAAMRRTRLTAAARHDASGKLVAYTDLVFSQSAPEAGYQLDTLVLREHRGHGLGLAVKLANLRALEQHSPSTRSLSTWNAGENEHMIAINEKMGFEVVSNSVYWLKKLGA